MGNTKPDSTIPMLIVWSRKPRRIGAVITPIRIFLKFHHRRKSYFSGQQPLSEHYDAIVAIINLELKSKMGLQTKFPILLMYYKNRLSRVVHYLPSGTS